MKEREISCMALSSGYTYLVVCSAPRDIQLIPRSFIHCRAKRKSILDNGSRRDWNELTFDVGELTLYVGELVVGDTTSIHLKHTHQSAL